MMRASTPTQMSQPTTQTKRKQTNNFEEEKKNQAKRNQNAMTGYKQVAELMDLTI